MSSLTDIIPPELMAGVWRVPSVEAQPTIDLCSWTIKKTNDGCYFVGTLATDGTGRVSTKIVAFDKENLCGQTSSGRIYRLIGKSGYSADGEHVWRHYKRINHIMEDEETMGGEDVDKSLDFVSIAHR